MISGAMLKLIGSFIWKFKSLFLLAGLVGTVYFGFQYIQNIQDELEDTKVIADTAIKEHNKVINNYNTTNEELKVNEEIKIELEKNNSTLKKKLETESRKRGKNEDWGNTTIPDSIRLLLQE